MLLQRQDAMLAQISSLQSAQQPVVNPTTVSGPLKVARPDIPIRPIGMVL